MTKVSGEHTDAAVVLDRLVGDISAALGESLVGLYVFGSWVAGDFDPERSDLDLLAVLEADPTQSIADELATLHQRLVTDIPAWADRVEVEYLSVEALLDFRERPHDMVRISPGEPLHLVAATGHYLLNWYSARYDGVALLGPAASELLPDFSKADFQAAVLEHARQWPQWVHEHNTPDSRAYAVLTVCRAMYSVAEGEQTSKRRAAEYMGTHLPEWRDLVDWAERLWYGQPDALRVDRQGEVNRFVQEVVNVISTQTE